MCLQYSYATRNQQTVPPKQNSAVILLNIATFYIIILLLPLFVTGSTKQALFTHPILQLYGKATYIDIQI